MKRTPKLCKRCGKNKAVVNFCNECCRIVSRQMDGDVMMTRMRAAVALCNSQSYSADCQRNRQLNVMAFMSVMHPEKSADECLRIARMVD